MCRRSAEGGYRPDRFVVGDRVRLRTNHAAGVGRIARITEHPGPYAGQSGHYVVEWTWGTRFQAGCCLEFAP